MFIFELLLLHGFSLKNREILNKAVLTPQEYDDFFFNLEKNVIFFVNLFGLSRLVSKKPLAKINLFKEKHFLSKHPQMKKMGSKSEK